jgi:hypothetical protein
LGHQQPCIGKDNFPEKYICGKFSGKLSGKFSVIFRKVEKYKNSKNNLNIVSKKRF